MVPPQQPVPGAPPPGGGGPGGPPGSGDLSLNLRPGSRTTSAPSSPAKTRESLLQRVQSLTGAARDQGASILGTAVQGVTSGRGFGGKDKSFILLVIDDQNTDWSKYFRGRRLHNDYDIRVEQAEFRELTLTASEAGCTVSMAVVRNGSKVMRSFKPDFVLIRQNLRDAGEDNKNLLLGLMYGGVPSVNNLQAIYNFQVSLAWLLESRVDSIQYSVLLIIFAHSDRTSHGSSLNLSVFNDVLDERHFPLSSKLTTHIIGKWRKSITGNWKSNTGSAMLEQLPVSDKHRGWVDQVCQLFGGLDICAIELLVGKDGREYIIEVNDSALSLMGDTQEEDRRHIAELVAAKMQAYCRPPSQLTKTNSRGSMSSTSGLSSPTEERGPPLGPPPPAPPSSHGSITSMTSGLGSTSSVSALNSVNDSAPGPPDHHPPLQRRDSQASQSSSVSSAPSVGRRTEEPPPVPPTTRLPFHRQGSQSQPAPGEDTEDTMKNLRKTFAGIFGDM
ncbi:unnamed protein product [Trichogramma brassicae]|uniref:Synapsin n=1 Tax=Trichogramma brassicae TaxID=86971 RepID=A0A6H5IEZ7_9HYME|nr:unnamed protein product [Trichogramma brassicae]